MVKRQGRQKAIEKYTFLGIEVTGYKANSETSLNYNLRDSHPRFARDEEHVYKFVTTLEITGMSTHPPERAGDTYELTLRCHESHPGEFSETLRDYQVRNMGYLFTVSTVMIRSRSMMGHLAFLR